MSSTMVTSDTRRGHRAASRRQWSRTSILTGVLLLAGVSTVTYPTAADWFSARNHATDVSGYVSDVENADASEIATMLDRARDYNASLPDGPLRDPYVLNADGSAESVQLGWEGYLGQLSLRADAPMARVRIPRIDVDLPIYHGTDAATLEKGVGHLYGSGLPVGGKGTHAVLTGHSGLPSATLFTDLEQLEIGDEFVIEVLSEKLVYRVDEISVVEPNDGDQLRQVSGHDFVTLLTCTPTGVNSHRLLVRGERIVASEESDETRELPANAADPGFPWWTLVLGAGLAGALVVAWPRRTRPNPPPAPADTEPSAPEPEFADAPT